MGCLSLLYSTLLYSTLLYSTLLCLSVQLGGSSSGQNHSLPQLSLPNNLCHVDEPPFFQQKGLKTGLEIAGAEAISPAQLVDVSLLVEVIAILADVVQLGVDRGVIFPTTF